MTVIPFGARQPRRARCVRWLAVRWLPAVALSLGLGLALPPASAAEIEGVGFDDVVELDGTRLALNGMGLRELYIVKTWVAALYAPDPFRSANELIADRGPRRLVIALVADVSIERVARSILDAMRRSHDPVLLASIEAQVQSFVAALRSIGPSRKGDRLVLDLVDGTLRLSFNGGRVGDPIAGPAFRDAVLRAFVGERPIDDALRRGLLGLPPQRPGG
jgi:hypothetical protein